MKFSAQEEYGLRCLLQLARLKENESLTIPQITQREGLTEPNVAKLLSILRKEGFIQSTRGQTGGYRLSRRADEIIIGDVMEVLGGRLYDKTYCAKHGGYDGACVHISDCSLKSLWNDIQATVDAVVDRITLSDLLISGQSQVTRLQKDMPLRRGSMPAKEGVRPREPIRS